MEFFIVAADIAIPGLVLPLLFRYGIPGLVAFLATLLLLETFVLVLIKWDYFGRAFLAALVMNLVSTVIGLILDLTLWYGQIWWIILAAFVISVIVEGGLLMLMKRSAPRLNFIAAVAANLASYLLLILPAHLILLAP
jgi:hypothetical protein